MGRYKMEIVPDMSSVTPLSILFPYMYTKYKVVSQVDYMSPLSFKSTFNFGGSL